MSNSSFQDGVRLGDSPGTVLSLEREERRRRVINLVVVLGVVISLFFAGLYTIVDFSAYTPAIALNLLMAMLWAVTPALHRLHGPWAGLWFFAVLIFSMLAITYLLGHASGSQLFLIVVSAVAITLIGSHPLIAVSVTALAWGAFVIASVALPRGPSQIPMTLGESENIFYVTSALSMLVIFLTYRYTLRLTDSALAALDREYRRSEELLLNVLPSSVAQRLKEGATVSDSYEDVTILFCDIVGFTAGARDAGAEETIRMLDRFFSLADRLAEVHGCEKIKTIGDCVLVASGLPEPAEDHAAAMARFALDLREAMTGEVFAGKPLRLRMGIHSGPAVGGVIGERRFAYDVWGDTVNVASRIQATADPDSIQLSTTTRQLIGETFACSPAGVIEARGAGRVPVWKLGPERRG